MLIKAEGSHFSFFLKVHSSRHAFTLLDIFIHMELNIIPVGNGSRVVSNRQHFISPSCALSTNSFTHLCKWMYRKKKEMAFRLFSPLFIFTSTLNFSDISLYFISAQVSSIAYYIFVGIKLFLKVFSDNC